MAEDTITVECSCGLTHEIDPEELGLEDANKYNDSKPVPVRYELSRVALATFTGLANIAQAVFTDLTYLVIHRGRVRAANPDHPVRTHSKGQRGTGGLTSG